MITDFQYVVTLLSSAGVSSLLAVILLFLSRTWISERLKNAIAHEYAMSLETHKALVQGQQDSAVEKIRSETAAEIARLQHQHDVELERIRTALHGEAAAQDRIRAEMLRWANPILSAVNTIESRLSNILEKEGYLALRPGFSHPQWSVTYEYFISSTLFAFASYFCWIRILDERLSFELFRSNEQKNTFFTAIDAVAKALRTYPPEFDCSGRDAQVFMLQQRAIGEMMIVKTEERPTCLPYDEFDAKLPSEHFVQRLAPLRNLLDGLVVDEGSRWTRLLTVLAQVRALRSACYELLQVRTSAG